MVFSHNVYIVCIGLLQYVSASTIGPIQIQSYNIYKTKSEDLKFMIHLIPIRYISLSFDARF